MTYTVFQGENDRGEKAQVPIKSWTNGVPFDPNALAQVLNVASLPFIHQHIAVMPDVHWGIGATIGSVIPTLGAVIPAAVGVDIGCGMAAIRLAGVSAGDLPDSLVKIRSEIEHTIPVGFAKHSEGKLMEGDRAFISWLENMHPKITRRRKDPLETIVTTQRGTLGGGNHFIELCLDEEDEVWVMLHSGSRGIGNMIGMYFIELAREDMRRHFINLPDKDLAYLVEETENFDDYMRAVGWAQKYALENRQEMLRRILIVLHRHLPPFQERTEAVDCHHNYVAIEQHFNQNVLLTRKGAVRAREGDLGIIPGSMGARSFIVRGRGNPDSFHSCSHGAGRVMGRKEAKRRITVEDHVSDTKGVECRKDIGVIDESPAAYKDIDAVMAAQADLVDVVHTLKQVLCVKG